MGHNGGVRPVCAGGSMARDHRAGGRKAPRAPEPTPSGAKRPDIGAEGFPDPRGQADPDNALCTCCP